MLHTPMRKPIGILASIVVVAGIVSAYAYRPADVELWKTDYLELRDILAASYANIGYASESGLSLRSLDSTAQAELAQASTVRGAKRAISEFVSGFGDPHLHLASEPPGWIRYLTNIKSRSPYPSRGASADEACSALGYEDGIGDGYSLPFEDIPGFRLARLENNIFSAASIPGAGQTRVGIIRISLFSPHRAKAACIEAWEGRRTNSKESCSELCEDSVYRHAGRLLADELRKSLTALEHERVSSVLVDLGGNGGGSEWVSLAVRAVTGAPLIVNTTLVSKAKTDAMCRWDDVVARGCSNLTPVDSDPETAAAFAQKDEPRPVLPLFVLVDERTASASEYFAAVLQDSGAARIIGTRTMGAGCGYMDGGGKFELSRTKLRVLVPNCVRLRKDGSNERAGIRPDVELTSYTPNIDRARAALMVASQNSQ